MGNLFLGIRAGSLGEISTLALLIGGAYLLIRKVITWHIPVTYIGSVAILCLIFGKSGYSNIDWMVYNLLSGGLVLGAFFMKKAGVESAIVSLGGNVQTLGLKPDGSNWNVAVEDPNDPGAYLGVLSVGQTAVITSGSYQRYFEQDGKVYHHILDPHTGYPADSGLKSVTIVCTSGVTADCLSTALFVLGKDAALNYWRTYGGFEMILVTTDDQVVCTGGLKNSFTLSDDSYTVTFVN